MQVLCLIGETLTDDFLQIGVFVFDAGNVGEFVTRLSLLKLLLFDAGLVVW